MAACRVRIQEHPGRRSKQPTSTTAGLSAETQAECHRGVLQQRRGRQRVRTAARRSRAAETTCGPYTGEGTEKYQQSRTLQFWQKETLVLIVAHCSADCRKPGGRGDDERQQAKCVTQDFSVVRLKEQFQFVARWNRKQDMMSKLDKFEKVYKYYVVVFLTTRGIGLVSTQAANRDVTGSTDIKGVKNRCRSVFKSVETGGQNVSAVIRVSVRMKDKVEDSK